MRERKWRSFIFLDINIFYREKWKFVTNVYRKKTFSGVYTNLSSFIPEIYKNGLIMLLSFRCFSLCFDFFWNYNMKLINYYNLKIETQNMFMILVNKFGTFTIIWKQSIFLKETITIRVGPKFIKVKYSKVDEFL